MKAAIESVGADLCVGPWVGLVKRGAGGHIGPPLHGVGEAFGNQRELVRNDAFPGGAGRSPPPYRGSGGVRGGVRSPRPTGATLVMRSSGPMYLRHGFRRPNFVPKFGAPVMGVGPYAPRGDEGRHAGSSCPTGGCGESPRLPGPAAHSGASAARSRGVGRNRSRDHPQRGQQPRTIPQSPSGRQLPLHKGAFGDGGCGSPRRPCGPPRNGNGFLSFRGQCAHWPRESVLFTMDGGSGRPTKDEGNGTPSRRALRKARSTTQASRRATKRPRQRPRGMGGNRRKDHPKRWTAAATSRAALSEAESAERVAGQIQVLPDDLFVQHGVQRSEVSAKPRPCSRRSYVN